MKKLLFAFSFALISICATAQIAQPATMPENTVLGLPVNRLPDLPKCTEQELRAERADRKCIFTFSIGNGHWEGSTVLIPEQEYDWLFPAHIAYSMRGLYPSLVIVPHENTSFDAVLNFFTTKYGSAINHKFHDTLETYKFHSDNMQIELQNRNNKMVLIFSDLQN